MERTAGASGRPFRVGAPGVGDREPVQRQHRPQRRTVPIEDGQPPEVLLDDVDARDVAALQRRLDFGAVFSTTVKRGTTRREIARRQLTMCDELPLRESPQVGFGDEPPRDVCHARDFRSRRRNLRVGAAVRRVVFRRDDAVLNRRAKPAARIVRLARAFDDERHQRAALAGRNRQREVVGDVRGIVAGPPVGEGVAVHVADAP